MLKKTLLIGLSLGLAGCMGGTGGYPAAQGSANNVAMLGNVISALGGTQGNAAAAAPAMQGGANNAAMLGNVIGALAGAQNPVPAQQAYGQNYAQNYSPNYAQQNQMGGILGTIGGQGNLNGVIQNVMVNQCGAYINSQPMWQTARMALGNQAQHWQNQICQCATQEAMNNMSAEQLTQLGMSAVGGQAAMTQATAGLLSQTATACLQRFAAQGALPLR